MRTFIRRGTLTALLAISLPLASVAMTTNAVAQQDKITELARAKFMAGVTAFDAKQYSEARDFFLQAYAMKRHPAVLLNLGLAEVRVGDGDSGANHLQQFLRDYEQATPQQAANARGGIAEAKKSSAYIILIVDTDGATVLVDGQVVGQSPLTDPVFVKAGDHDVEARAGGRAIRLKIQARVGAMASAQLNLRTGATEAAPESEQPAEPMAQPTKPKPEETSSDDPGTKHDEPNRWSNDVPPAGDGPYMNPGYNSPDGFAARAPAPEAPSRSGFVSWLKAKPAAIATLSVGGGLGLLGTIGFGAAAGSAKGAAGDVTNLILKETQLPTNPDGQLPANYYNSNGGAIPCGTLSDATTAHPYYRDACDQLRSNLKAYDVDMALMATSLVVMTLSVGGTYIWYYLDTDPKSDAKPADQTPHAFVTVAPILSTQQQGLSFVGTF